MEPIGCPEMSVLNCHFTPCKISEEYRSHLHRSVSLVSRVISLVQGIWPLKHEEICGYYIDHHPKYENGEWKSRTNRELEEMSKGENIVKWIKGQTISWLGHLERMEEDRMPRKIFTQEVEGTRRRWRPRKRWKEEAERDLQVLGVRRLWELVADRKK